MPAVAFGPATPSVTVQVPVPMPTPLGSTYTPMPALTSDHLASLSARGRTRSIPRPVRRRPTALIFPHGLEQEREVPRKMARLKKASVPVAPPSLHEALIARLSPAEQQELESPRKAKTFENVLARALAGGRGSVLPSHELHALSLGGRVVQGEYDRAYAALSRLLGEHHAKAWWELNAILSAQTPWAAHTEGALRALTMFLTEKPKSLAQIKRLFTYVPGGGRFKMQKYDTAKAEKVVNALDRLRRLGRDFEIDPRNITKEGTGKTVEFASAGGHADRFPADVHMWSAVDPDLGLDDARGRLIQHHATYASALAAIRAKKLPKNEEASAIRAMEKLNPHGQILAEHRRLMGSPPDRSAYKAVGIHVANESGLEPREVQETAWADILAARVAKLGLGVGVKPKDIAEKLTRPTHLAAWDMFDVLFHTNRDVLDDAADAVGKTPKHVDAAARDYLLDRKTTAGSSGGGPQRIDDPALAEARLDVFDRLPPANPSKTTAAIASVLGKTKARYQRSERRDDAADGTGQSWAVAFVQVIR